MHVLDCTEGEWRLWSAFDNTPSNEGIPQRCSQNGTWESLCRYSFSCDAEGRVACRQLGFGWYAGKYSTIWCAIGVKMFDDCGSGIISIILYLYCY